MNMTTFKPFIFLISLLGLALVSSSVSLRALSKGEIAPTPGVLFLDVKTGNPGTTSDVSITLADECKNNLTIPNLVVWDDNVETVPGHVYFQTWQLDKLIGAEVNRSTFASKPCFIKITTTGSGSSPNWYLDTIMVRSTEIDTANFSIGEELNSYIKYNVELNDCPPCPKGSLAI